MNQRVKNKKANQAAHAPKPTIKSAVKEVETGATHLAEAVRAEVQNRAGEAVSQAKDALQRTEERAEKLLEKIPNVGAGAAQKLNEVAGDGSRAEKPAAPARQPSR